MKIKKAFNTTFKKMQERKWDTIYIAIDMHDTISKSTYKDDAVINFYKHAEDCLRSLSTIESIKLILFTSTPIDKINLYLKEFKEHEIYFDFINSNPEAENNAYGDFSVKPYFNILFDDKAGFNPKKDWKN